MKQRTSLVFRAEQSAHALRFTCEHCSYFDSEPGRCSHGYPNAAHLAAHFEVREGEAPQDVELIFCKDFELQ